MSADQKMSEMKLEEARLQIEKERLEKENERVEAEAKEKEEATQLAMIAAEKNHKKMLEQMNSQYDEKMLQIKKQAENQEAEV